MSETNDRELSLSELMGSEYMEEATRQAQQAQLDDNTRQQEPLRAAEAGANEESPIDRNQDAAKSVHFSSLPDLDEDGNPIIPGFNTVTYNDLMGMEFDELWQPVEGFITEGLTALVGGSKIGKSWLCLDLSYSVATGSPFLGKRTHQCPVLYLALEDSLRRLQERNRKQGHAAKVDNLWYANASLTLDDGFDRQLASWLDEHGGRCLVIVDVLQRVNGAIKRKDGNAYQAGYEKAKQLKAIADRFKAAVVVVHHTKRGKEDDVFDTISGGNGLMSAADATIIMSRKRNEEYAIVDITGRDVTNDQFTIRMDENQHWHIAEREEPPIAYDYNPYVMVLKAIVRDNPEGTLLCVDDFLTFALEELSYPLTKQSKEIRASLESIKDELLRRDHIKVDMTPPGPGNGKRPSKFYKHRGVTKPRTKENPCPCVIVARWVCKDDAEQLSLPNEPVGE